MTLRDWLGVPAEALHDVYQQERRVWLQQLRWDTSAAWNEVERARLAWGLPGFVATDRDGRIHGLTYYMIEDGRVDIGGLASDAAWATDLLLDGILDAAHAAGATSVRGLLLDAAAALPSGLRLRKCAIHRHLYLAKDLNATAPSPSRAALLWAQVAATHTVSRGAAEAVRWCADDVHAAAALLSRAYDQDAGRLFAPRGDIAGWRRYVNNLVRHVGCGTMNPAMTQVLHDGHEIIALALVSDIAPGVAHLVQLAVDPRRRGERLGDALVQRACHGLRAAGYTALTLLVEEDNHAARAIYERAGFRPDATFVALDGTLDVPHTRHCALASV